MNSERVIDVVSKTVRSGLSFTDNLYAGYEALEKTGIVTKREIDLLCEWLKDVA